MGSARQRALDLWPQTAAFRPCIAAPLPALDVPSPSRHESKAVSRFIVAVVAAANVLSYALPASGSKAHTTLRCS